MQLKLIFLLKTTLLSIVVFAQPDRTALLAEFSSTKNDSLFISKHSKEPYREFSLSRYHFPEVFSPLDSIIFFNNGTEKIIGPLHIGSHLIYLKITAIDSLFRMRAGNIWLNPEKRGEDEVNKLAEDILKTVKRTGDFDAMSKEYSDDGNTKYEADLGWIFQGVWVKEFENEILKHKKGEYFITSTMYGKHVVKIIENAVLDRFEVRYVLLYLDK